MSKIGKQPVKIPTGVTVVINDSQVNVSGPKGSLSFQFRPEIRVSFEEGIVNVNRVQESKYAKSLHGLTRSVISNMVKGVTEGHQKTLEIIGVGYRVAKQGESLLLSVGYSHSVIVVPLPGIEFGTLDNKIIISGIDKVTVGEMAARIRRIRPPEPYKGKGIKYIDEIVRRKAGKAQKATA